jgi:hypothetical protein
LAADPAVLDGVPPVVVVVLEFVVTVPLEVEMLALVDEELLVALVVEPLVLSAIALVTGTTAANLFPANAGLATPPVARIDVAPAISRRRARLLKRLLMFELTFRVCELAAELSHGA